MMPSTSVRSILVSEDAVWATCAVPAFAACGLPVTNPKASMARAAATPVVPSNIALVIIPDPLSCSVRCCRQTRPEGSLLFAWWRVVYNVLRAKPARLAALQFLLRAHGED